LFALVLCTCTDAPTGLRHGQGHLSIEPTYSREAQEIAQSLSAAGLAIDKIFVEVRGGAGDVRASQLVDFPADQSQATITVAVRLTAAREQLTATIQLRSGSTPIFAATTPVTMWQSQTTISKALLTYVGPGAAATLLKVQPAQATIGQTGSQQFAANALAANQSPVIDLPITAWTSSDLTVATVSATGLVQGVKTGTVTITAHALNLLVAAASLHVVGLPTRFAILSGGAQTTTVGSTLTQPFQIQVLSAAGEGVPGVPITFQAITSGGSVGAGTATTDVQGLASTIATVGTAAGTYEFRALITGAGTGAPQPVSISATAHAGAATTLSKVSGDAQSGTSGQVLPTPLVVRVADTYGNPVSGASVTFTRVSGTGAIAAATVTTGADGLASTAYTLGAVAGSESIRADVAGLTGVAATFSLTSAAGAPSAVGAPTGDSQHLMIGASPAAPLVALVTDTHGNPVPGVTVGWRIVSGYGSLSGDHSVTNSLGEATVTFTTDGHAGTTMINASVGESSKLFTVVVDPGAPAQLSATGGNGQRGVVGTTLTNQLSVAVVDAHGNPVPGFAVTFTAASGGVGGGQSFNPTATATTDATGTAQVAWQLGTSAGVQTVAASAAGLTTITFAATAVAGAASQIAIVTGNNQSAAAGAALPIAPSVRVTDSFGNPLSGITVTFTPASGAGSLSSASATTDASGMASGGSWTLGTAAGVQSLDAKVGTLGVSFSATALPTLAVTLTGAGSGSVASQPASVACALTSGTTSGNCSYVSPLGQVVVLTATPTSNSTFDGFGGVCAGKNPCSVTMSQSQTIAATFSRVQRTLTISGASGNGVVSSSPAGINCTIANGAASATGCTAIFLDGTPVTLSAAPAAGFKLGAWAGACSGSTMCAFSMTQDQTVRATFSLGTWTVMQTPTTASVHGIWGSSASQIFAAASSGVILKSDGQTWSSLSSDASSGTLWGMWGSSPSDIYATLAFGSESPLLHYDGATWTSVSASTTASLFAVWGSSANDVYVCGDRGTFLHYDGRGGWTPPIPTGTSAPLLAMWGSSASDIYIVGFNGVVLHFDGQHVTPITLPNLTTEPNEAIEALGAVWGSSPNDVWIGGGLSAGDVWHFDGASWTKHTLWNIAGSTGQGVNGLWGTSSSDIWAVGEGSAYHFDGTTWTSTPLPTSGSTTLIQVWGSGSLNVFATGTSNGAGVILSYQ
jgi:adhesin/invasin